MDGFRTMTRINTPVRIVCVCETYNKIYTRNTHNCVTVAAISH